jgi:hypothetical protein
MFSSSLSPEPEPTEATLLELDQNPPLPVASTSAPPRSEQSLQVQLFKLQEPHDIPKCQCVPPHGKNLVLCIDGTTNSHTRYVSISMIALESLSVFQPTSSCFGPEHQHRPVENPSHKQRQAGNLLP